MCRLYGFIANEPTKVDCSLVFAQNALMLQSRVDSRGGHHSDGWGIATYQDGYPVVKKKTTAAFDDQHFSLEAEKVYSQVIIAHVRKATVGRVSIENTHPFVSGRWVFAHNGTVTGFERICSRMEKETASDLQRQRLGDTDSEQYFLWLLTRLREARFRDFREADEGAVVKVLVAAVERLRQMAEKAAPGKTPKLNFVLTDGNMLAACRWNRSLHMIRRHGLYDCEICGIPHIHHHETVNHRAVAVASEPITHEAWQVVANHHVFAVRGQG
jgi:glutamine amidotransferase